MDKLKAFRAVKMLLESIEGEPLRPELLETPSRVAHSLMELLDGYDTDVDSLFKTFDGEGRDQVIVVRDIAFTSFCEHHVLPFSGKAHVAYLPVSKVLGVSKIPRIVLAYAHRLQLQERLARQVANSIMERLEPQGVAVVIEAEHLCIRCRGVKSPSAKVINSVMLGAFREDRALRMEVLALLGLT